MLQQGIQAFQSGNFDGADSILKRVIQVDAKNLPALHILGLIKASQENYKEAANLLARAARIAPNDASIQYNLAKALADGGSDKESIPHHKKSVELAPNNPEAWLSYGKTASNLGRHDDALVCYDKALSLKPDYAEAALNKGAALKELKRYEEAVVCAERALTINPNLVEGWLNKGVALKQLKRYDEAIAHYDKAISLKPDYHEAWTNKGATLHELKRYDEAITHYDKAISLKPDADWTYGDLLHVKMKVCFWSNFQESLEKLIIKVLAHEKIANPFSLLALTDDALLQKQSSEIYAHEKYPFNPALGPIAKRPKSQKIRIGYFSADFRNHAVSTLTAELFELHDKNRFETIAFSLWPNDKSPMRLRLIQAFDQFIDASKMSDFAIARLSRDLGVDIAIDLGGFTLYSRAGIFSYRAAPIQLGYIGYLGTMGNEYMDYLVADKIIIPENSEQYYSEKIVYLPSYQVNDRQRIISNKKFTRQELGLPEKGFVFCCFNNNYKILPSTFDVWMRILKAVDGSVLFLYAENRWVESNLKKEAEIRGVSSKRIVFGKHLPADEYLAQYRICDLFLDTTPYNAGTTGSDALWAGLPILTLVGEAFASRVAASLLSAVGLSELITNNQEEYEALAIEIAKNPQKLAAIKQKLASDRLITPLFNTPRFTKNLEAAYLKMYDQYQAGLQPESIYIEA